MELFEKWRYVTNDSSKGYIYFTNMEFICMVIRFHCKVFKMEPMSRMHGLFPHAFFIYRRRLSKSGEVNFIDTRLKTSLQYFTWCYSGLKSSTFYTISNRPFIWKNKDKYKLLIYFMLDHFRSKLKSQVCAQ